jgi:hypothetical protein
MKKGGVELQWGKSDKKSYDKNEVIIIIINIRHAVHSIAQNSVSTNPDIFLSLSYSFRLVAGWRSGATDVFCHCGEVDYSYRLSQMSYFYDFEESETLGSPNRILLDTGPKLFKTHKTRTVPGKPGWMGSLFVW